MQDFFRIVRDTECIVEYTIEDGEICIFDVYPLLPDGTKGVGFELTEEENSFINEECWQHYDYDYGAKDWELRD